MKRLIKALRNLGNWLMLAGIGIAIGLVLRRSEMKNEEVVSQNQTTKHHILPTSRGGEDHKSNIAQVAIQRHRDYHTLLSNLTPVEIITWLVEYFWAGKWEYVEQALEKRDENN